MYVVITENMKGEHVIVSNTKFRPIDEIHNEVDNLLTEEAARQKVVARLHAGGGLSCAVEVDNPDEFLKPLTQGAIEVLLLASAAEHCQEFLWVEGVLYGQTITGKLVHIPPSLMRYFGVDGDEYYETVRIPGRKDKWITATLEMQRACIIDDEPVGAFESIYRQLERL